MIEDKRPAKPTNSIHNIILESGKRLSISGVTDIDTFNAESVLLQTELGPLDIRGEDLHMNKLSLESGEVIVEGTIIGILYTNDMPSEAKGGLFSRMFK